MHLKVKIRNFIRKFDNIERWRTIRLVKIKLRLLNKSSFDWAIFKYSSVATQVTSDRINLFILSYGGETAVLLYCTICYNLVSCLKKVSYTD